jgi:hypothetical protein
MEPILADGAVKLTLTVSGTASLRTNQSLGHLRGAALFARDCARLEEEHTWPATEEVLLRHGTAAVSAVMLAVAGLEATANEIHLDALDRNRKALGKAAEAAQSIEELWDTIEQRPVLRKFNWFLTLAGVVPMKKDTQPYMAAADLVELRNALVHYRPEWSHSMKRSPKLEARLRGKFPLNRLSMPDQFFIPYRCLGYGCAKWAVETARALLREFYSRLEVEASIDLFVEEMDTYLAGTESSRESDQRLPT